jgi:hypothetical protein
MPRNDSFWVNPDNQVKDKSLRTHAREAAEYLTGLPYLPKPLKEAPRHPGRGVSGESGN